MITTVIVIFLWIIVLPVASVNGEWGTFWLTIALGVFILYGAMVGRDVDRAYIHRTEYWAMSGKDRARARKRWNEEAKREEEEEREAARERARKRREHPDGIEAWKLQSEHGVPFWERKYRVDAKDFEEHAPEPEPESERRLTNEQKQAILNRIVQDRKIREEMFRPKRRIEASDTWSNRTAMDNLFMTNNRHRAQEILTCPECGRYIRTESFEVPVLGEMKRKCECPVCNAEIWM